MNDATSAIRHHSPVAARCLALLCATLPAVSAQTSVTIPSRYDTAPGNSTLRLPFGLPGFRTQLLVDAAAIAPNGAQLTHLRLRTNRGATAAAIVPNVTITLSHTLQSLAGVSPVFANNQTTSGTVVFRGTIVRPGYTDGGLAARAWDVVVPFAAPFVFDRTQGNLLIDIRADNQNPPTIGPENWLDAAEPGGSAVSFGESGQLASFDSVALTVGGASLAIGQSVAPLELTIGRTVEFVTETFHSPLPGVLGLSLAPLPQPIDLAAIGAPGNTMYVVPDVFVPLTWATSLFGSEEARVGLVVPNSTGLIGALVYGQSAVLEPGSNALGVVTTNAAELHIGAANEVARVRQIDAYESTAAVGAIVDVAEPGQAPRFTAAVFRLDGVFF
jgi:hypothetical protein